MLSPVLSLQNSHFLGTLIKCSTCMPQYQLFYQTSGLSSCALLQVSKPQTGKSEYGKQKEEKKIPQHLSKTSHLTPKHLFFPPTMFLQ